MSHVSYVKWKIMAGNSEFELLVSWISCCQLYPIWHHSKLGKGDPMTDSPPVSLHIGSYLMLPNYKWRVFHVKIIGKYRNNIWNNEGFRRVAHRRTWTIFIHFSSHGHDAGGDSPGGFKRYLFSIQLFWSMMIEMIDHHEIRWNFPCWLKTCTLNLHVCRLNHIWIPRVAPITQWNVDFKITQHYGEIYCFYRKPWYFSYVFPMFFWGFAMFCWSNSLDQAEPHFFAALEGRRAVLGRQDPATQLDPAWARFFQGELVGYHGNIINTWSL